MHGYCGRLLRVDLAAGTVSDQPLRPEVARRYIGGSGLAAHLYLEEIAPKLEAGGHRPGRPAEYPDPLGPDNPLLVLTGPLTASRLPAASRWTVSARSPLTGIWGEANVGGYFGARLKTAGYDGIVVTGRAPRPVYLLVDAGAARLAPAGDIWGKDTYETDDVLGARHAEGDREAADEDEESGDARRAQVLAVGPAGENLVRFAAAVHGKHHVAGRAGMGAVMGSKNLKAIAARGRAQCPIADPAAVKVLTKKTTALIRDTTRRNGFREHGTPGLCVTAESLGDMPIKNWAGDTWPEGAAKLGAPNYTKVLGAKPLPCLNCPIGCHRLIKVTEPAVYATEGPGPEYETLGMIGTNCLIDDLKAVAKANDRCNRLGLDTISAGAAVAFTMECFERGWLKEKDLGGLRVAWGDGDAAVALIEKIAARHDFGDALAAGTLAAAKRLGREAEAIVSHVKGLEFPAHDPRSCFSLAPTYATTTRGACHMRGMSEDIEMGGFFIPELGLTKGSSEFFVRAGKGELAAKVQDYAALLNSLVICAFMPDGGDMPLSDIVGLLNATTGWSWSVDEAIRAGERVFTLQRLVNLADGHGRATDTLPPRTFQAAKAGFRAGQTPAPFAEMLDELYRARGWDADGRPTRKTLRRLDLEEEAAKTGLA